MKLKYFYLSFFLLFSLENKACQHSSFWFYSFLCRHYYLFLILLLFPWPPYLLLYPTWGCHDCQSHYLLPHPSPSNSIVFFSKWAAGTWLKNEAMEPVRWPGRSAGKGDHEHVGSGQAKFYSLGPSWFYLVHPQVKMILHVFFLVTPNNPPFLLSSLQLRTAHVKASDLINRIVY